MAYARRGPSSDVYVFSDGERYYCHECPRTGETWVGHDPDAVLAHLGEHVAAGDRVPPEAVERLRSERSSG